MKKSNILLTNKSDVIKMIFQSKYPFEWKEVLWNTQREKGLAFSPTNIALCKYWGKRDSELNLPMTSSLSITLPDKGAMTTLTLLDDAQDKVTLNGQLLTNNSNFVKRIVEFLDLFRLDKTLRLNINITSTVPIAAGLASSACGFASLISALNDLFSWNLSLRDLSILARLGSGSAARSFWPGFVEWHAGVQRDGMDSYGEPIDITWPSLLIGILPISTIKKPISSRQAMERTITTSCLYESWPKKVVGDLALLKQAIKIKNMLLFGGTTESNALTMHATMLSSWPPICYFLPDTMAAMHKIWNLRAQGLEIFFTQDAGPNLKLLFQSKDKEAVIEHFSTTEIIQPFTFE